MREGLDRPVHDSRRLGIALGQQIVELLFGDLARLFVAERVLTDAAQRFAPLIDEAPERRLAGAVADKAVPVFELNVIAYDFDARQAPGAMG